MQLIASYVFQEKIKDKKNKITLLIRDNTNRLDQLNLLMNEQKQFEKSLDSRQKNLVCMLLCKMILSINYVEEFVFY